MPLNKSPIREIDSVVLRFIEEEIVASKKPEFVITTQDYDRMPGQVYPLGTILACEIPEHKVSIAYTQLENSKVITLNIGYYNDPRGFDFFVRQDSKACPNDDMFTFLTCSLNNDNIAYFHSHLRVLAKTIVTFMQNGFLPE